MNKADDTINPEDYKKILEKDVKFVNELCEQIIISDRPYTYEHLSNVKFYQKCMVRSVMQHCGCDFGCVLSMFKDIKWSNRCYYYDLKDIYNITDFLNCNGATHRPFNGDMKNYYFGNNLEIVKKRFLEYADEICKKPASFNKLKCEAYELRDECANIKSCYGHIRRPIHYNCTNPARQIQLSEAFGILYDTPNFFTDEDEAIRVRGMANEDVLKLRLTGHGVTGRRILGIEDYEYMESAASTSVGTNFIICVIGFLFVGVGMFAVNKKFAGNKWAKIMSLIFGGLLSLLIFLTIN